MNVLYLSVPGILQPWLSTNHRPSPLPTNASVLEPNTQRPQPPRDPLSVLDSILAKWPQTKIVLTTKSKAEVLPVVCDQLGPIAHRVIGNTYADLTQNAVLDGGTGYLSDEDFKNITKEQLICLHLNFLKPSAWVAVDEDIRSWLPEIASSHLVRTHAREGLLTSAVQKRLTTLMCENFGPATL